MADHVVVGEHPGRRGARGAGVGQRTGDDLAQLRRVPAALEVLEVERLAQFVRAGVQRAPGARDPCLGDRHPGRRVGVEDLPPVPVDLVDVVPVVEGVGAGGEVRERRLAAQLGGAEVAQRFGQVLDQRVRHVDPEAVDAAVGPELERGAEVGADLLVLPVQVGLLGREQVEVPLPVRHPLPGAAAEDGLPVGGREFAPRAAAVAEDVAVAGGRTRARLQGLAEPRVPVRGVVGDQVDDHLQAQAVGLGGHGVEVVQGPQARVDVAVILDVVTAIGQFGGVERAEPQGVDAQGGQVGQALGDAAQVTEPVAVGVGEAAGVDLVDDGLPPPVGVLGRQVGRAGGAAYGHAVSFTVRAGDMT